jgi:Ricin-type beta-trefoil lectin domain/Putative Ig domain
MTGKSRARLSRIFATAVLGAGLAATCAASTPGNSAGSGTTAISAVRQAAGSAATVVAYTGPIYLAPVPTQQNRPDSAVTLTIRASDKAGDPLTFSATGLPPGLSINSATGLISGTTTAATGSYDVAVTASDPTGASASISFAWRVWNTITVTPAAGEETIQAGTPVTVPVSATDSGAGQTLTFSATGLPPGLSINPATGVITGSASADGQFDATITATDSGGSQGSETGQWDVNAKAAMTSPGNLVTTAGQLAQIPLKVGDTASNAWLYYGVAGGPPGAYVNWNSATTDGWRTATLTGWPAPAGTYKTTISLIGDFNSTASVTFTWTVKPAAGTGPTGPVRLDEDNMCLDDTGNSSANGNKVQVWACNGGAAQRWTYAEDGTLRIHGKCLDDTGYGTKAGTKLQLWSCTNHTNQMWTGVNAAALESPLSGLCLSPPYGFRNGTQVELGDCGETGSAWTLPAGEIMSGVPGQCVTDSGGGTANSTKIVLGTCADSSAQRWTVNPDGTIRIFGKCLSLAAPASGSSAVLWSCGAGHMQQWSLVGGGMLGTGISAAGPISFTGPISVDGYSLESPLGKTANGTQLVLGTDAGSNANWHIW